MTMDPERRRLEQSRAGTKNWRRWGPYVSERQWGTVREDYSPGGTAWDYFTHDQARSRAYRWGEDGIAGIFDEDKYFDVEIEYAKADAEDVLMRLTVHNRGPDLASIHVLPQIWFRNIWSWSQGVKRPVLQEQRGSRVRVEHEQLGVYAIAFEGPDRLL